MRDKPSSKILFIVDGVLFLTILGLVTGVIDLGIPVIETMLAVIVLTIMVAFGRFTLRVDELHEAMATQPRFGTIHHADGTTTQVRFLPTEEAGVFTVCTLTGRQALMRQGDRLQPDYESPYHEFVFADSPE